MYYKNYENVSHRALLLKKTAIAGHQLSKVGGPGKLSGGQNVNIQLRN